MHCSRMTQNVEKGDQYFGKYRGEFEVYEVCYSHS